MHHKDVKEKLLKDSNVKKEYEELDFLYKIKRQVISLRKEKGLSQKELAELVGTKQSAISRLENEDYNPSVEMLAKIAKAFDKELEIKLH